jgi:hypothetical protein
MRIENGENVGIAAAQMPFSVGIVDSSIADIAKRDCAISLREGPGLSMR